MPVVAAVRSVNSMTPWAADRRSSLFAVDGRGEVAQGRAAGADDELADAAVAILPAAGVLRREALVVVVVAVDDDVGAGRVEGLPERVDLLRRRRARRS